MPVSKTWQRHATPYDPFSTTLSGRQLTGARDDCHNASPEALSAWYQA
jgi:hypothetical protein